MIHIEGSVNLQLEEDYEDDGFDDHLNDDDDNILSAIELILKRNKMVSPLIKKFVIKEAGFSMAFVKSKSNHKGSSPEALVGLDGLSMQMIAKFSEPNTNRDQATIFRHLLYATSEELLRSYWHLSNNHLNELIEQINSDCPG